MKKVLIGLVVVLVLVVAALFVAPPMLGNSLVKSRIIDGVKEATGRDLQIGDVSLAVLPAVEVSISDLRLANADNMPSPEMLSLGRLDLELALFPLIGKEIIVERLVISDLTVALEVNEAGAANWIFPGDRPGDREVEHGDMEDRADRADGLPLANLRLGDVRLENASFAYRDLTSGQSIEASDFNLTAELSDIAAKLALTGGLVLNGKPIDIDVSVDSPQALMTGEPAKIAAAITSELVSLRSDLDLAQRPQPAVDGDATIEIGSVGALLAWLEQPLPEDQPDPGPVRLAASFKTEGAKVLLQEAVIEGEALDLKADGSFESIDGLNKVALTVESGVLDIDRYLPPPAADAPAAMKTQADGDARRSRRSPMEAIPDDPIDLSVLKQTEADIKIAMAGIKAAGYEVGALALTLKITGGKLQLDLNELALYGGGMTGTLGLDASGEGLGVEADFGLDQVDLGALSAVARAGEAPVAGIASGRLTASGRGATPRALVRDLKGGLVFKVGEVDVKDAAAGTISGIDLAVDLPGLSQSPSVTGEIVYNQRKVRLDVGLDPLDKVLAGDTFAVQVSVDSELLKLTYDGAVQQQPVPGLNGTFGVDVTSVGELMAWLGQPLPDGLPDPGPLEIDAKLAADGEKVVIESASITGKAAEITASGAFDGSGAIPRFDAKLDVAKLDLNAYLPPPSEAEAAAPATTPTDAGAEGWSEEPIGAFSELKNAEGQAQINLANVIYRQIQVESAAVRVTLAGGVLKADVTEVRVSPGQLSASAMVDGSGDAAAITYQIALQGVESKPFLQSFAGTDILSGRLNFETKGSARGVSPKQIVSSLNGDGAFAFLDGAIEGFDLAGTLRNVGRLGVASGGEKPKTDFSELTGSFTITDGVLDNRDMKMFAPLVRVTGAGQVPLPPRTLDYNVEAKLVASLEGQGGGDALAGLPIPVHAYGPWDRLSYDIDYEAMFRAAAADPARLANLPADLADKASQFGVNLPIPGLGDGEGGGVGALLEGLTGGGEFGGGLGGVLEGLLGGGTQGDQPQAQEGPEPSGPSPTPSEEPEQPSIIPDLGKQLKGLFD
jgi:AsmA protein